MTGTFVFLGQFFKPVIPVKFCKFFFFFRRKTSLFLDLCSAILSVARIRLGGLKGFLFLNIYF